MASLQTVHDLDKNAIVSDDEKNIKEPGVADSHDRRGGGSYRSTV
jgi:hypothetical protein